MNKVLPFVVGCIALCAGANAAGNCITFRAVDPNAVANDGSSKPSPTRSQKLGGARNDCEPGTRSRTTPDATRLVHTFPDGTRLYADPHKNGIQKYSAIDQRGRALKVMLVRNPPKGMVPGSGDAIERGKQRAERIYEQRKAMIDDAIAGPGCVVKIAASDGSFVFWDLAGSGMGCP
jgi:hypothetical protein